MLSVYSSRIFYYVLYSDVSFVPRNGKKTASRVTFDADKLQAAAPKLIYIKWLSWRSLSIYCDSISTPGFLMKIYLFLSKEIVCYMFEIRV